MPDSFMETSLQDPYIPKPPMELTDAQLWARMNSLWIDNKAWKDQADKEFAKLRAHNTL